MNKDDNKLSIITWNVWLGPLCGLACTNDEERYNRIIKNLQDTDTDIICLQEFYTLPMINLLKNKLKDQYDFYYDERNILIQQIILFIILFILYFLLGNINIMLVFFLFINFIFKNSTFYSYLLGEIKGGLLTLINKNKNIKNIKNIKSE